MTQGKFKTRYTQHKSSFKLKTQSKSTTLSQHVWKKQMNPSPAIKWEIITKCPTYKPGNKSCNLCTTEKLFILKNSLDPNNLNKRNDIFTRCIHRKKYKLDGIT